MAAKINKVACQGCGAALEVDESIRFVTCRYCSARLEIVHDPSTIHSKQIEEVLRRQESVEEELRVLRLEKRLARLDREWESFREAASTRGKSGEWIEPHRGVAVMAGASGIIFGIALLVAGIGNAGIGDAGWAVSMVGIVIMIAAIAIMKRGVQRAEEFTRMRSRMQRLRSKLTAKLAAARRNQRLPPMKRSGTPD